MTYYNRRLAEFRELVKRHGSTITKDGKTAACVRTPADRQKEMGQAAYLPQARSTFDVLRADDTEAVIAGSWASLELGLRKSFTDESGSAYEVTRFKDDPSEPTIQFEGVLVK